MNLDKLAKKIISNSHHSSNLNMYEFIYIPEESHDLEKVKEIAEGLKPKLKDSNFFDYYISILPQYIENGDKVDVSFALSFSISDK